MRVHLAVVLVLPALLGGSLSARSDRFPKLNVAPLCHAITDKSTLQLGFRNVTFDECMKAEQEDRQTMIKEWSTFSPSERQGCVAEATMGGESSYTDLVTCLEMARDVRRLKRTNNSDQLATASSKEHSKRARHHRERGL
jgi:hypothetical protein